MFITKDLFSQHDICSTIIKFLEEDQTKHEILINELMDVELFELDLFDWFNYNLTRIMNYKQCLQYAVYAAKLVLPIFEENYPKSKKHRKCIKAAIKCIDNPSKKNKKFAYDSYYSIAYNGTKSFRYSASSCAALVTYDNPINDWPAFIYAYYGADYAVRTVSNKINKDKIINYGFELLQGL